MTKISLGEEVHFDAVTHNPSTGAVSDADSTPTFSVYEEATDTAILGPTNMTKRTALTGNYRGTFDATTANGFEAGKWYNVIVSATVGTVAGKSVALTFKASPEENTAGYPLVDVGLWSGTAVSLASGLPEVGVGFMNNATITSGVISSGALTAAKFAADYLAAINAEMDTGLADYDGPTRAELTTDINSVLAILGTPAGADVSADIAAINALIVVLDAVADSILVDTDSTIPGLIAALENLSAAQVNAEMDTALADYDSPTRAELTTDINSVLAILGTPAGADVSADIAAIPTVAELLTTQMTESYAADGVAPTLAQAIFMIQQMLGDFTITGTTLTVRQLDGSTVAATFTLNDAATPTALTRAS